jgi:hypothetical protein
MVPPLARATLDRTATARRQDESARCTHSGERHILLARATLKLHRDRTERLALLVFRAIRSLPVVAHEDAVRSFRGLPAVVRAFAASGRSSRAVWLWGSRYGCGAVAVRFASGSCELDAPFDNVTPRHHVHVSCGYGSPVARGSRTLRPTREMYHTGPPSRRPVQSLVARSHPCYQRTLPLHHPHCCR